MNIVAIIISILLYASVVSIFYLAGMTSDENCFTKNESYLWMLSIITGFSIYAIVRKNHSFRI